MALDLKLRATQTITPQLIATMTILQYGTEELEDYLSELSYENPMLEVKKPQVEGDALLLRLRWLQQGDRNRDSYYDHQDQKQQDLPARQGETLVDFVKEQILTLNIDRPLARAMETAADLLTDRGYFDGTPAEVARLSGCDKKTAQQAISLLKTLEPHGVGAGDLKECLLLQLAAMEGDTALAQSMVREHLENLRDISQLAEALNVTPRQAEEALAIIKKLRPYPGDGFAAREDTVYVRPDLMIFPTEEGYAARAVEESAPSVSINAEYLRLYQQEHDPEVRKYLRQKLSQVEQLMHNLQSRSSTMVRCGEAIAQWQGDFFSGGDLKKMTLRDIAGELGVHESTICRTVRNKYVQCPQGLYPMADFFSRDAGQNFGVSRRTIKKRLSQLIAEENPKRPLSDEKLSRLLEEAGLVVSRRTVTKYRLELGIPAASGRKIR